MAGDQPFMLCQESVARLFGHSSHRTISNWIKALKALDMLRVAEQWKQGRATRYFCSV
jgi:predicted AAA+ superfamily ATPase